MFQMIKTKHISINLTLDTHYWNIMPVLTLCVDERSIEIGFLCFYIEIGIVDKSSLEQRKTFSEEILDIHIN